MNGSMSGTGCSSGPNVVQLVVTSNPAVLCKPARIVGSLALGKSEVMLHSICRLSPTYALENR